MNTPRNDFEEDWDEQPAPGSASLNPTTPGYQYETPIDGAGGGGRSGGGGGMVGIGSVENRSVGPFTPGSALNFVTHSPYAANPSPLGAYHQHSIFNNQGKSWPDQVPTPGSAHTSNNSPSTPGGAAYGYAPPQTPGASQFNLDHSDWHMDGLLVRIKDSY